MREYGRPENGRRRNERGLRIALGGLLLTSLAVIGYAGVNLIQFLSTDSEKGGSTPPLEWCDPNKQLMFSPSDRHVLRQFHTTGTQIGTSPGGLPVEIRYPENVTIIEVTHGREIPLDKKPGEVDGTPANCKFVDIYPNHPSGENIGNQTFLGHVLSTSGCNEGVSGIDVQFKASGGGVQIVKATPECARW